MNDGTDATHAVKTVTAPAATVDALPAPPARNGYTFVEWNTKGDGSGSVFDASTTVNADITVYAQWTVIPPPPPGSYSVTFKLNDGTDTDYAVKTVAPPAGTVTDFPANPERTGYDFTEWNTRVDGSGSVFDASTAVSASITVYAQWTVSPPPPGSHSVTFKKNDGTEANHAVKFVTPPADTVTDFPANPSRNGYDFGNWNTQADGSGSVFDASTTVSGNITVYAQWTGKTYTVTFMRNYAPDTALHVKTVTVPAATIAAGEFPGDPSRTDYTFGGWNTRADGSGSVFDASTTVRGNITVYATWARTTISLDMDTGAGAFNQADFTVYKSGGTGSQTVSLTGSGYTNPRWFVDGELKGTADSITVNAADYTAGKHILSLEASKEGLSWSKELPFTVEAGTLRRVLFRSNDGAGTIYAVRTLAAGSSLGGDFPEAPGRDGYDFGGWNTRADGSGSAFNASATVTLDTTVYARWNPKTYTVTFDKNGGDTAASPSTLSVTRPALSTGALPAAPVRTGYTFAGWNTQADGLGTAFGSATVVAADMTVYAQWAHEQFAITLKPDAGAGAFSQTDFTVYKGGGTGSQTLTITGSGYTNPRWEVDGELKGTADSITVNAADYGAGKHHLTLIISKGGVSWSGEISFTVDAGTLRRVLFRSNDGAGTIYALRTLTAGSSLGGSFPEAPGRDGYDFGGWNTQADGLGSAFNASAAVTLDTTVYAVWNPKTYTVTFDKNGGDTAASPPAMTVTRPALSTGVLPAAPTRTGYNFAGWNTEADGSGAAFGSATAVAANMTVYAQWAHEQFAITLKPDAGAGAFSQGDFTVSKTGSPGSQTLTITGSGYTNPRWEVDGELKGTGTSITIYAAEYGVGKHHLSLIITRGGVSWSKEIVFTVDN
jgi:uncharacterized repeat protein (TIGR02543 family)